MIKKIITLTFFLSVCFVPLTTVATNLEKYNTTDMTAEEAKHFSFAVISDTPEKDIATQGEALINSVAFLNEKKPEFIVLLGDMTANGKQEEFNTLNEVFVKKITAPLVPVAGNHDFLNGGSKNWYKFWKNQSSKLLPEYNSATLCGKESPDPRFRKFTYKGIGFDLIDPYFDGHKYGLTQQELDCIDSNVTAGDLVFRHVTPYGLTCQDDGKICGSSVLGITPGGLTDIDQLPKHLISKNAGAIFAAHTHGYYHGKCNGLEYVNNGTLGLRAREYVKGWTAADIADSFTWVDVTGNGITVTTYVYNPFTKTFAPQTKNFPDTVTSQLTKSAHDDEMEGVNATCKSIQPDGGTGSSTETVKELKIVKPTLEINIPQLKFSDLENSIDSEGNLTLPYIGEYMSAIYKVALVAISIIAVIMIIVEGVKITTIGGEARAAGLKKIGQVVIGLFIAWGSYTILYTINPDLVNFNALKVKYIIPEVSLTEYHSDETGIVVPGKMGKQHTEPSGQTWVIPGTNGFAATLSVEDVCALNKLGKTQEELNKNQTTVTFLNKKIKVHKFIADDLQERLKLVESSTDPTIVKWIEHIKTDHAGAYNSGAYMPDGHSAAIAFIKKFGGEFGISVGKGGYTNTALANYIKLKATEKSGSTDGTYIDKNGVQRKMKPSAVWLAGSHALGIAWDFDFPHNPKCNDKKGDELKACEEILTQYGIPEAMGNIIQATGKFVWLQKDDPAHFQYAPSICDDGTGTPVVPTPTTPSPPVVSNDYCAILQDDTKMPVPTADCPVIYICKSVTKGACK